MAKEQIRRGFYRGATGRAKSDEELEKNKARAEARKAGYDQPFRFRVAVGETTQFIVLDEEPDFFRYEHNMKDPATGIYNIYTGCVDEWDNCPVCEALKKEPYYAMYLTVIDLTPFKTKNGEEHDFSRKLLVVKPAQQKKFYRQYSKLQKEGGSLRGALFEVTRDSDKDSAIGNDIEFIETVDEDELATYVRSWKDKEGKKHTENCSEVYDYEKLFEPPDTEKLRAIVGGSPTPGSRKHEDAELGKRRVRGRSRSDDDGDEDEDGDDGDWQKPARSERMGSGQRTRPAGARRQEPDDDDRTTRRTRTTRHSRPADDEGDDAPRTRRARPKPADDEGDDSPRTRRARPRQDADIDDDDVPF